MSSLASSPRTTAHAPAARGMRLADWLVVLLVLAALAAGWLLRTTSTDRFTTWNQDGITLAYPAEWQATSDDQTSTLLYQTGAESQSAFQPILTVASEAAPAADRDKLLVQRTLSQGKQFAGYRGLGTSPVTVANNEALLNEYAYVYDSATTAQEAAALPVVVRAQELLVIQDARVVVVTFATAAEDWERLQPIWQQIQASFRMG